MSKWTSQDYYTLMNTVNGEKSVELGLEMASRKLNRPIGSCRNKYYFVKSRKAGYAIISKQPPQPAPNETSLSHLKKAICLMVEGESDLSRLSEVVMILSKKYSMKNERSRQEPVFPVTGEQMDRIEKYPQMAGLSIEEYAAIHLRIPNSGQEWLDEMIKKANRRDAAIAAMQALLSFNGNYDKITLADLSVEIADEILK